MSLLQKERVALIGCGGIAAVHAWALGRLEQVQIVGFCDVEEARAKTFSERYTDGAAGVYTDYEEMLDAVRPDALHICTPHALHVPMAKAALQRGISVFCEKPPAMTWEEFASLRQFADKCAAKGNARIGFCFQNRYNKTTQELDAVVKNGCLGKVTGARAAVTWRRDEDYYAVPWKGSLEEAGGGALINQSIHTLDLLLRYFPYPKEVRSSLCNHHLPSGVEVEDTIEAWMEFDGGQRACFYASTGYATDAPVFLEYQFEHGRVTMLENILLVCKDNGEHSVISCEEERGIGKDYWGNGHFSCIRDFYSACACNRPFANDLQGVEKVMKTMAEIYAFARSEDVNKG